MFNRARLAWQTLNYAWDTHVLSFDGEAQEALFASVGVALRSPLLLFATMVVIIGGLLGIYAFWMRVRARPVKNRVRMLYENFCRKAASLGVARSPTEGPLDFSNRARRLLPAESERIQNIIDTYVTLRYSAQQDRHLLDRFAAGVRTFGQSSR